MFTQLLPMLQDAASGATYDSNFSYEYSSQGQLGTGGTIAILAVVVIMIVAMWKMFTKAGKPGWAAIVPIYNLVVLLQIAGKPMWWIILLIIPFVNFIILLLMNLGIAKNFGKSGAFGVGLFLLGPIFIPILAFGSAQYIGPRD